MQLTLILPLRQALDSLKIARYAIESDEVMLKRIDDLTYEITDIIEELEAQS